MRAGEPNPGRRVRRWRAAAGLAMALAACSPPMAPGPLDRLRDDQFAIRLPGPEGASATGIGCGATEQEALELARRTAQFNLRRLTGASDYQVEFSDTTEVPDAERVCRQVSARAAPRP